MKALALLILVPAVASMLLAGCAEVSRVEMDYGTSFKLSKFNQTLNPDAEKNLDPVVGLNGQAANKVMDKYNKEFEKPAQAAPSLMINLGK
jgi:hypothetical protein